MFAAAKAENETRNEADKVWVIGVDRDQSAEGAYTSKDGKESNFVLASTLKQVGAAVKDIATKAENGEFPGGEIVRYTLADKGVELAETNLSDDAAKAVADAKQAILDGEKWDGFAVTEDLNLSVKILLKGGQIRYCGETAVYQEAVLQLHAASFFAIFPVPLR